MTPPRACRKPRIIATRRRPIACCWWARAGSSRASSPIATCQGGKDAGVRKDKFRFESGAPVANPGYEFFSRSTYQLRLKPALRLLETSPAAVSLIEPVTLTGPPNSFCSALSVRSHLSSVLDTSAPTDTLVSVGRMLKRSAWLLAQL